MKKYLILFSLILFVNTSYAQAPRIDSMLVDEMKGELHIFGSFGSVQGKVTVDSVDMHVLSWADTLITTSIPDTGRGSAGGVMVEEKGIFSEMRMISLFKATDYTFYSERHSRPYEHSSKFYLQFRMDLQSILFNKSYNPQAIVPKKETSFYKHCINACPVNYNGVVQWSGMSYNTGFQCTITFSPTGRTIDYTVKSIKGLLVGISGQNEFGPADTTLPIYVDDFNGEFTLDSQFNFIIYSLDTTLYPYGTPHNVVYHGGSITFPPPSNLLLVRTVPSTSEISFSCFPNPSSKQLTILYSIPEDGNARIILYDLTGRIIRESTVNTIGENRLNWDVSQIPSGSYVVGLATGKESRSQLVSIVH
jgi:hypothetical protein